MKYTPIAGTLGYIISEDKENVLLVHRTRENDDHLGKFNGLGGKMERNEDLVTCMKREIYEEAGITCTKLSLRGSINWTNFGPKEEDWLGFIFRIDAFEGTVNDRSPEGPLKWVAIKDIMTLPLWEGDKHFLPLVFDDDPRAFHGYMPYNKDKVQSWSYVRV